MHVYLLRHGDASNTAPDGSLDDDHRELTEDGISKLRGACTISQQIPNNWSMNLAPVSTRLKRATYCVPQNGWV